MTLPNDYLTDQNTRGYLGQKQQTITADVKIFSSMVNTNRKDTTLNKVTQLDLCLQLQQSHTWVVCAQVPFM